MTAGTQTLAAAIIIAASCIPAAALAQGTPEPGTPATPNHQHGNAAPATSPDEEPTKPDDTPPAQTSEPAKQGMDHSMEGMNMDSGKSDSMQGGMKMGPMQGGAAPPDARSPDYSQGVQRSDMHGMEMADSERFGRVLLDTLEFVNDNAGDGASFRGFGWYGSDMNKLFIKAEGEAADRRLGPTRVDALWDRLFATFWSTQAGIRQDLGGEGPRRTWAALGLQGLAPYWFDVEATFYVADDGRTAFRTELEYDVLLTQRLILRPNVEANLYGRDEPARNIGSGLSDVQVGVRLRYEIRRQFAPYIGVEWQQRYGRTADFARAAGERRSDTQVVAGLRTWF